MYVMTNAEDAGIKLLAIFPALENKNSTIQLIPLKLFLDPLL
jgi:hypothetical protein